MQGRLLLKLMGIEQYSMTSDHGATLLGGVDKFEPVSGGSKMNHAEEGIGQLVVAGRDGTVDFQLAEHPLDTVALLVQRPVVLDLHAAV